MFSEARLNCGSSSCHRLVPGTRLALSRRQSVTYQRRHCFLRAADPVTTLAGGGAVARDAGIRFVKLRMKRPHATKGCTTRRRGTASMGVALCGLGLLSDVQNKTLTFFSHLVKHFDNTIFTQLSLGANVPFNSLNSYDVGVTTLR